MRGCIDTWTILPAVYAKDDALKPFSFLLVKHQYKWNIGSIKQTEKNLFPLFTCITVILSGWKSQSLTIGPGIVFVRLLIREDMGKAIAQIHEDEMCRIKLSDLLKFHDKSVFVMLFFQVSLNFCKLYTLLSILNLGHIFRVIITKLAKLRAKWPALKSGPIFIEPMKPF